MIPTAPKFTKGNKFFVKALNDVVSFCRRHGVNPAGRAGWSETADGWIPPDFSGSGIAGLRRWDLQPVPDSDPVTFTVVPASIFKSLEDLTETIPIVNVATPLTLAADKLLRLKITGPLTDPVITLELDDDWEDYPAAYETTSSGATAAFAAYFYPLWQFITPEDAEDDDSAIQVADGVFGRKIATDNDFLRSAAVYHKAGDRPFAVPFLIPYHRPLV
jgi:hypothetical protein